MNEDTKFTDLSELLHDHESAVANWMEMFNRFHVAREKTYKRSFAKRGEIGVWMNLARKYDRFEGLAPDVLLGAGNGVTLIDTLVDTAMYALKWIDVISKIRPEDFKEWIQTVYCKDTGMSYEYLLEAYPFLNALEETPPYDDDDMTAYRITAEFPIPKNNEEEEEHLYGTNADEWLPITFHVKGERDSHDGLRGKHSGTIVGRVDGKWHTYPASKILEWQPLIEPLAIDE